MAGIFAGLRSTPGERRGGDGSGRSTGMEMTGETGVDWRNCCQSVMLFTSTSRALMENSLSHSVYSMY